MIALMMAGWLPAETAHVVGESQRGYKIRTLNQWVESIRSSGRIAQNATRKEIAEGLDIVATAMMAGKATLAHADALLSMRFALMNSAEKSQEYTELTASEMGRKGGSVRSAAKSEAAKSRNAKRKAEGKPEGGRPRKNACVIDDSIIQ